MTEIDIGENSVNLVLYYRDMPLKVEDLHKYSGLITRNCKKYFVGKMAILGRENLPAKEVDNNLAQEFGYTFHTVRTTVLQFAKAIDRLFVKAPDIAMAVIANKSPITYNDIFKLSKDEPIKKQGRKKTKYPELPRLTIKNTLPFDYDSQTMSLVYTIPSWVSTIERAFMASDLNRVSPTAKIKLAEELTKLNDTAQALISMLND